MSTKNPRIMVVLEPRMMRWVRGLARREGLSLSMKIRDLLRDAYEHFEDRYWSRQGERRLRQLRGKGISHETFWKKSGL